MTELAPGAPNLAAALGRSVAAAAKRHPLRTVIAVVVSGAISWLTNVWLMAVKYDGHVVPSGSIAAGSNNTVRGDLFWFLAPMVVAGIVSARIGAGRERFWNGVRSLPATLGGVIRRGGRPGRAQLLAAVALSLVLALVLPASTGLVLGIGILAAAPSVLGLLSGRLLSRGLGALLRPLGIEGPSDPMLGLVGAALGLGAAYLVTDTAAKVVLAIAAIAAAALFARGRPGPTATVTVFVVAVAGVWLTLRTGAAFADDGGFSECGESWSAWRNCQGSGQVISQAMQSVLPAGMGGLLGSAIGGVLSGMGPNVINGRWVDAWGDAHSVNDGRWPGVEPGWVYWGGEWIPPADAVERTQAQSEALVREGIRQQAWQTAGEQIRNEARTARIKELEAAAAQYTIDINEINTKYAEEARTTRIKELRQQVAQGQASSATWTQTANTLNTLTNVLTGVQLVADAGVDALAAVTGPVGKVVKTGYTMVKNTAEGAATAGASGSGAGGILLGGLAGAGQGAINVKWSDKITGPIKDKIGLGTVVGKPGSVALTNVPGTTDRVVITANLWPNGWANASATTVGRALGGNTTAATSLLPAGADFGANTKFVNFVRGQAATAIVRGATSVGEKALWYGGSSLATGGRSTTTSIGGAVKYLKSNP